MQRVEIVLGKRRLVVSFHRPRFSALLTTMRCLRSWTCELVMHGPRATAVRPTPASDDRITCPRNSNPRIVRDILDNESTRLALQTLDLTSSNMSIRMASTSAAQLPDTRNNTGHCVPRFSPNWGRDFRGWRTPSQTPRDTLRR